MVFGVTTAHTRVLILLDKCNTRTRMVCVLETGLSKTKVIKRLQSDIYARRYDITYAYIYICDIYNIHTLYEW